MKLIKLLPWLLAALPLAAIIVYSFGSSDRPSTHNTATKNNVSTLTASTSKHHDGTSLQLAADGSQIKLPSPAEIEARKRYQEAKKKADEFKERSVASLKTAAQMYTPEFCNQAADNIMKRRDSDYQKQLASWNVDNKTIQTALSILRQRELLLLENRGKYFQDSSSLASAKANTYNKQTEDLVAVTELELLLGKSRAIELLNKAKELQKSELMAELARTGTDLPIKD